LALVLQGEIRGDRMADIWLLSGLSRGRSPGAVALAVVLFVCCGQIQQTRAQTPPPPAVGVRPAEIRGVARSYEFVGRIGAINTVQLRARVEGFLDKILFKEGQDVAAGDLLYQIETAPYQAQADQAKANLAAAQAQALNAELQYNRSFQLAQNQNAPQAKADQDKAAMDSARAQVMQTQAALAIHGTSRPDFSATRFNRMRCPLDSSYS